ncbi:MAG: ABC transporter permease [Pseudonocardiales bacterium]|nr:ABC transporter permease [Actinomycetota bacterium]
MSSSAVVAARTRAQSRVRWELLAGLIRKDLKVKYQGSVLGFLWSLVNPLVLLVVYTFVFQVVLGTNVPRFGYYLLSGLLIWNAFSGSVGMATDSVVSNSGLVKKVRFPLGVLPLTAVGFNLVHYALQTLVLILAMAVTGDTSFVSPAVFLLVPAILVALVFMTGLSFLVAALNVRYRDTKHIVEVVLMAAFWVSPIVYPVSRVADHLHGWVYTLYYLNPMTAVVSGSQRALYGAPTAPDGSPVLADSGIAFYLGKLGLAFALALAVAALGLYTYRRLSADFAEEL